MFYKDINSRCGIWFCRSICSQSSSKLSSADYFINAERTIELIFIITSNEQIVTRSQFVCSCSLIEDSIRSIDSRQLQNLIQVSDKSDLSNSGQSTNSKLRSVGIVSNLSLFGSNYTTNNVRRTCRCSLINSYSEVFLTIYFESCVQTSWNVKDKRTLSGSEWFVSKDIGGNAVRFSTSGSNFTCTSISFPCRFSSSVLCNEYIGSIRVNDLTSSNLLTRIIELLNLSAFLDIESLVKRQTQNIINLSSIGYLNVELTKSLSVCLNLSTAFCRDSGSSRRPSVNRRSKSYRINNQRRVYIVIVKNLQTLSCQSDISNCNRLIDSGRISVACCREVELGVCTNKCSLTSSINVFIGLNNNGRIRNVMIRLIVIVILCSSRRNRDGSYMVTNTETINVK